MYGLINAVYDERKQKAFESLYLDSSSRDQFLMRAGLAETLKDCPKFISSHGTDWILCSLASYHKSEDETMRVFQGVMRKMDGISFGLLTDDIRYREMNELADSCLICISFFRKRVEMMHQRSAAPSVDYYMKVGSVAFQRLGWDGIADNFNGWVEFIEDQFVATSIF